MDSTPSPILIDSQRLRQACLQALDANGYAKGAGAQPVDPDAWQVIEEVGSTNQALMALPFGCAASVQAGVDTSVATGADATGVAGPAAPRLLVAWRQVAGRGRRGRVWNSPPQASLTFSIAFERVAPPTPPVGWPIAVGVAIAESLASLVGDIGLKWPNDLQRQGRKCGGILAETRRQVGDVQPLERVVTGIGLNLLPDPQRDELAGQPTIALFDDALPMPRETLLAQVFAALCRQWQSFQRDGLGDNVERWQPFDSLRGREVAIIDNGQTLFTGLADGIDATGALRVAREGRVQAVTVGDVSVRRVMG